MSELNSQPWIVSDHSGDLRIVAWGADCLEALAHASRALIGQIVPLSSIREAEERTITVSGDDDSARYIAFLNEILYLVYTQHWLPVRVRQLKHCLQRECRELEAILVGEPADPVRHEFKYDIKAVTYHDFEIRTEDGKTILQFVCDL